MPETETLRILVAEPDDFCSAARDRLSRLGDVELRHVDARAIGAALREYDVVWFRLAHRITRAMLAGGVRCRVIATPVTGLDHIDLEACREAGVQVAALKGETAFLRRVRATAELTLALTLGLLRHVPAASASVSRGEWNRDAFRGTEVFEKTVGIVGLGRLGTITAGYFRALGADVIGYDPRPDFPVDSATRVSSLIDLLERSDIVSLHVTYDRSTHHLVGQTELARMKPTAILVNTSRGGVVDAEALLDALTNGRIRGAALDVLEGEPDVTADHPLVRYARTHANLLMVPHIGGNTVESFEKTEIFLADKVARMLAHPA